MASESVNNFEALLDNSNQEFDVVVRITREEDIAIAR